MNSSGADEYILRDEYISRIVSTYSQNLFRIAFTILHCTADAEDTVQEVFIALLKKQPVFNDSEHEKAWLIRVTINTARNFRKKQSRCDCVYDIPDSVLAQDSTHLISAVLELPEKYRTVIHLFYYEDLTIKEIAQILHLPAATVGTRLARGRAVLKNKLLGDDYFD